MAQWNSYSSKTSPDDTDTLMLKDNSATGAPNKKLLFSGLWTWIVGKLTNTTISALDTSPKTVVGGLNALNSKAYAANLPNTIYCVKVGKVCYLTFEHSTVFTAEVDTTICTLPVGFRPNYAVSFVCPLTGYRISVGISGVISCNHALNENVLRGGITYIISD